MKRISLGGLSALLALGIALVALPTTAAGAPAADTNAECFAVVKPSYPPTSLSNTLEPLVLVSGHFVPGGAGTVVIAGGHATDTYCGFTFSAAIQMPATVANASGELRYSGLPIPSDFQLNAMHHIDIYKRGSKVGNFDFCVDAKGDVAPVKACMTSTTASTSTTVSTSGNGSSTGNGSSSATAGSSGNLARTGVDHLIEIVRWALLVLAAGAAAIYGRRRLQSRQA